MNDDATIGVLEQEQRRKQEWADRGLPDPVRVLSEERITRRLYGLPRTWHSPDRPALDAFFAENHEVQPPNGW
jgi:hypothetical protein